MRSSCFSVQRAGWESRNVTCDMPTFTDSKRLGTHFEQPARSGSSDSRGAYWVEPTVERLSHCAKQANLLSCERG